jgi:hypothetical protein
VFRRVGFLFVFGPGRAHRPISPVRFGMRPLRPPRSSTWKWLIFFGYLMTSADRGCAQSRPTATEQKHMKALPNLNRVSSSAEPIWARGVIRQLKHLSAGTDIPTARLISTHNGVGYGYIGTPAGEVFFDYSAITNLPFDRLATNMTVEFVLDKAPYLRASSVTVIADRPGIG